MGSDMGEVKVQVTLCVDWKIIIIMFIIFCRKNLKVYIAKVSKDIRNANSSMYMLFEEFLSFSISLIGLP